jgi:hypothetical protein
MGHGLYLRAPPLSNLFLALGHDSKAVHRAYSKPAEVTVPSLDAWEKER